MIKIMKVVIVATAMISGLAAADTKTGPRGQLAAESSVPPAPAPVPYATLQPPPGITPAPTRGWIPWGPKALTLPRQTWTPEQRRAYEARVQWFHTAKYGLFFHFLAFGDHSQPAAKRGARPETLWTSERWNQVVDAVDVEQAADQARELGVGYVFISLGQNHRYACAPNPIIDQLWGLEPGQYNSRRDLPMELGRALAKRGISLMLYIASDHQHMLPQPPGWTDSMRFENWLKVAQWYSEHYGTLCKGWWVDGMKGNEKTPWGEDWMRNYPARFVAALKRGNPDALVAAEINEVSDFIHGHCIRIDWERQRRLVKPYFGRWDPDFKIQWHVLQHLGTGWADIDAPKATEDLVAYAVDVVRGGGVFTFEVGGYKIVDGKTVPCLDIPAAQMAQLRKVRDALRHITPSDGSGAVRR